MGTIQEISGNSIKIFEDQVEKDLKVKVCSQIWEIFRSNHSNIIFKYTDSEGELAINSAILYTATEEKPEDPECLVTVYGEFCVICYPG